jgi:hypothetical protein
LQPIMAYTDSAGLDSNKTPNQFLTLLLYQLQNITGNLFSSDGRVPQENNTASLFPFGINQLTKILIFCQEDSFFANSKPYYLDILCPWMNVGNGEYLVPIQLQRSDNCNVAVLIS